MGPASKHVYLAVLLKIIWPELLVRDMANSGWLIHLLDLELLKWLLLCHHEWQCRWTDDSELPSIKLLKKGKGRQNQARDGNILW